ncbi:DSBA-like thioredoxin domain protein [Talaromyces stipitatus ATCC 10500]|uniref:DSBA-like thioredoxin domain protein n=1 Tax=Talaromyces stipitatus (strain ATCC 10500 / CBS 375.48 / QM 6759 / NRRL 1006) TaxID=441959 RepID=B8M0Q0_TALSN|nr:DSBA-like thioredoxin domain protein [Talaromyces stipitatus ATCC 10500]EED21433.1 DSBA-like thioredoxin domain protein [Talaromyces stipitatus ATCC 10500]
MAVINIEMIFDIVCAWCYIGKRTLDKAISIHQRTYPGGKNDIFNITLQPYYLNYTVVQSPDRSPRDVATAAAAAPTIDKQELAKTKLKHMSEQQKIALEQRMNQIGSSVGIHFRSGGKIGSTRAAHHLIHLAQLNDQKGNGQGASNASVANALVARLFEAYHELEMDVSDRDALRKIAVDDDIALDSEAVGECLDFCFDASSSSFASSVLVSDENGGKESIVDRRARENRLRTNTSVPMFIIQGEYRIDGAQDLMEFVEIFGKIRESTNSI